MDEEIGGTAIHLDRDWRALEALLADCAVAALLCDDQESKSRFVSKVLSTGRGQGGVIVYIDLDTAFTVFLEDHEDLPYGEELRVFRPRNGEIDDVVADVCSLSGVRIDTVVFDSVTSLYSLQEGRGDSSKANRRLGLYLALLTAAVSRSGGRIILTSLMRSRRRRNEDSWYQTYAGGRLLRQRSDLILKLSRRDSGLLDVSVLKCRDPSLEGLNLQLDREDIESEGDGNQH